MPAKESASVKTHTSQPPQQPSTGLRAARKALGVATTCTLLSGCPGAQVRLPPPSEPCPAGVVEAMKKLGIATGGQTRLATFFFTATPVQRIIVTEGPVNIELLDDLGDLPEGSTLSGQLTFGERVYGRFTRARSEDGRIDIPVCLEMVDVEDHERGVRREPSDGTDTVKIFSTVRVRVVDQFR
jgi:hypothetical protein